MDTNEDLKRKYGRKVILPFKLGQEVMAGKWKPKTIVELLDWTKIKRRELKKMLEVFEANQTPHNYLLAKCITPYVSTGTKSRKLNKQDYLKSKANFNKKIKNRLRTLNKYIKPQNLVIRFRGDRSEIRPINS